MEFLFSSEFGRIFFIVGTIGVMGVVWNAYFLNRFSSALSWALVVVFVLYVTAFLFNRYTTGHMEGHMAAEPSYIALAATHGIISLLSIALACFMLIAAGKSFARGENYFISHKKLSLLLVILWPLALFSGFLI